MNLVLGSKYIRQDIHNDPDMTSRPELGIRESCCLIQRTGMGRNAHPHTPPLLTTLLIHSSCAQLLSCQRHAAFLALVGFKLVSMKKRCDAGKRGRRGVSMIKQAEITITIYLSSLTAWVICVLEPSMGAWLGDDDDSAPRLAWFDHAGSKSQSRGDCGQ